MTSRPLDPDQVERMDAPPGAIVLETEPDPGPPLFSLEIEDDEPPLD